MDKAFISAFAALAGSIVGGLTAGITTWLSHRSQARAGHRLHHVAQREDLYRDFVVAASEAYGKAIINSEAQIQDLVILHGLIGRMRILSSSEVIACAEDTVKIIMDTYYSPNKTILELRELIRNGKFIDPTRKFSETSRQELAVS